MFCGLRNITQIRTGENNNNKIAPEQQNQKKKRKQVALFYFIFENNNNDFVWGHNGGREIVLFAYHNCLNDTKTVHNN